MQEQFFTAALPKYPSLLFPLSHQQVHGPSVHELILAEENDKVRLVVYILETYASPAELDISRTRQFHRLFLTLI